jgi:hypothetical protein
MNNVDIQYDLKDSGQPRIVFGFIVHVLDANIFYNLLKD